MVDKGLFLYLKEVEQTQREYLRDLEELRVDLLNGHFKRRDYLASRAFTASVYRNEYRAS